MSGLLKVACSGGIGIRKKAEYPGERTGEDVQNETIHCYSEKKTFLYSGIHIMFYKLTDNRGWIHNYHRDRPGALDTIQELPKHFPWRCAGCTCINNREEIKCLLCGTPKKKSLRKDMWKCATACAHLNHACELNCSACGRENKKDIMRKHRGVGSTNSFDKNQLVGREIEFSVLTKRYVAKVIKIGSGTYPHLLKYVDNTPDEWVSLVLSTMRLLDQYKHNVAFKFLDKIHWQINSKITVISPTEKVRQCTIIEKNNSANTIKVHYDGFDPVFDEWISINSQRILTRPQMSNSLNTPKNMTKEKIPIFKRSEVKPTTTIVKIPDEFKLKVKKCFLNMPFSLWMIVLEYWNTSTFNNVRKALISSKTSLILNQQEWFQNTTTASEIIQNAVTIVSLMKRHLVKSLDLSALVSGIPDLLPMEKKIMDFIIICIIANEKTLIKLKFNDCILDIPFLSSVIGLLKFNTTVKILNLRNNKIDHYGIKGISDALVDNLSLKKLVLDKNNIGAIGVQSLIHLLKNNSTLTSLSLKQTNIGDDEVIRLGKALETNSALKQLTLKKNGITSVGAASLANMLLMNSTLLWISIHRAIKMSCLNELELNSRGYNDLDAIILVSLVRTKSTLLQLELCENEIGDSGASCLGEALKDNSNLKKLMLNKNKIADVGATSLATALKNNSTLTKLLLNQNKIADAGAVVLGETLAFNSALLELHIAKNAFGDVAANAIGQALQTNSTLNFLDISMNNITDNGARGIAEALKLNSPLAYLYLNGTHVGDATACIIGKAIMVNTILALLNISATQIGNVGAIVIAEGLKNNHTLKRLDIGDNEVSEKGRNELKKYRKEINHFTCGLLYILQ